MDQTDETKIALIGKDIGFINENIKEIKQTLLNLSAIFVPLLKYEDDKKVFELRIERLEKASNLWRWLSPTLSAVLGATITFLLMSYIQNLK